MKKNIDLVLLSLLALLLFSVECYAGYQMCKPANVARELKYEKEQIRKCGRPGTSDLFPDLRPCDY